LGRKKHPDLKERFMPYKMVVEGEGRGILVTWQGIVSGEDILAANEEMYAKNERRQFRYQIWDFLEAVRLDISEDQILMAAYQDKHAAASNPNQIVALVGTGSFFAGADRCYSIYAKVWSGFESQTFLTMSEAREWIRNKV
jgi:hypothetical protein